MIPLWARWSDAWILAAIDWAADADPAKIIAAADAISVAAPTTLVRMTMGSPALSVVEAAFVSAEPLSPSPHAPRRSTPPGPAPPLCA